MKSSRSYSKALFLSLSVIVLVTSGCDRRGRAPIKSVSAGPMLTSTSTNPLTPGPAASSAPTTNTTSVVKKTDTPVLSTTEAQLVTDAQMTCDVASVDDTASATKDGFLADLDLENGFQKCMKTAGLVLNITDKDVSRIWTLDSSAKPEDKSAAYTEFARLAKLDGSDDGKAAVIMKARLDLSVLRLGKMTTKYSDDRMRSADFKVTDTLTNKFQKTFVPATVLSDVAKSVAALQAGAADIEAMKTVSDGADLTQPQ